MFWPNWFLHAATRVRCSWLGKGRSVLDKFLWRFEQEAGSKQAHLVTERAWPTFSIAVRAHRLHLLHHPRGQLPDHDAHAPAPAGIALLNGASLPSLPAAQSTSCMKRKLFRKKPKTPSSSRLTCLHAQLHCQLQLGTLLSHPSPTQSPWIVPVPSTASFKFNNLLVWKQAPVQW